MIRHRPSPNHDSRGDTAVDMIVLHYTGMLSAEASLARLCDPSAKVSAHYLIEENGMVWQMVAETRRAWHAGIAFWAGRTDINAASIGIELQNPGHEHGYRDFPQAQISALVELLGDIRQRHTITDPGIVGHSDIAPDRKLDPGELFPWHQLARAGHGIWPEMTAAAYPVPDTAAALSSVGYAVNDTPEGSLSSATILALQRRFLPEHLSGQVDQKTIFRLGQVFCQYSEF